METPKVVGNQEKSENGECIKIQVIVFELSSEAEGDMELHLASEVCHNVVANIYSNPNKR